ncbi:E3 ubiquitin-protein ligase RNF186 [Microcaecilia unicolor]|uniref:E3 ubiquitin-protein ligase RNF186 n=1 Tax=Microcaecilia unicolor TaxID=1415580 RepID=A0A6P7WFY6_9AMPH|nr:E3 ubiquitin-protein ligase RNF186 [Microcaecilia unicolor]
MAAAGCIDLPVSPVVETDSLNSMFLSMDTNYEDSPKPTASESDCLGCSNRSATENHNVSSPMKRATEKDYSDCRKSSTAKSDGSVSPKPSASVTEHRDFSEPSVEEPDGLGTPKLSRAAMDCPVCFSRYNSNRAPKLLACQHIFCAICLKLLLRNEDGTWLITCPLCRTSTVVFGGLICSLQTREDLMDSTSSNFGVQLSPQSVACPAESSNGGSPDPDDDESNITATARRLVVLLLILVIVVMIILQFIYSGLLKWVLCFMIIVLVIMSVVLCSRVNFQRALWFIDTQKDSQIVSVA